MNPRDAPECVDVAGSLNSDGGSHVSVGVGLSAISAFCRGYLYKSRGYCV